MSMKFITIAAIFLITISSCSKKTNPSTKAVSAAEKAPVSKTETVKTPVPKVITVNDKSAKRSVDGRYYYDLEGHRYWRNNKDGKYYLFNKSMYNDDDFKGPVKQ